jgi:hypothetical protein
MIYNVSCCVFNIKKETKKIKMVQGKHWVFTLNNYNDENQEDLRSLGVNESVCSYLVFGREVGESGTPHLQGYVRFVVGCRPDRVKRLLKSDRFFIELARGNAQQASEYCKKQGDYEEFGRLPAGKGKRSDLDRILEWLDGFITETNRAPTEKEVATHCPEALLRYRDFMRIAQLRAPEPVIREGECRPWQRDLESVLELECTDERTIRFYVDENGGSGKTWFQQYLFSKYPERVQLLQPGKYIDMAYTIDSAKDIFLINVPRLGMEFFAANFRILESLKDRMVFSPKYTPQMKILMKIPHVVVFSNERPPRNALSRDRYRVFNLYNPVTNNRNVSVREIIVEQINAGNDDNDSS